MSAVPHDVPADEERRRLRAADEGREPWRRWRPTSRPFPHDHARSPAYRSSEDGVAAICDEKQRLRPAA